MEDSNPSLGLSFFGSRLFYAVNDSDNPRRVNRIGSYDFNVDISEALLGDNEQQFRGISKTVDELKQQYSVQRLRIHSFPSQECWTTVPKIVYDDSDERENHINILMNGVDRKHIHPTWYNLSNQGHKFLLLRNRESTAGLQQLAAKASTSDMISDFEIGMRWIQHANPGGSFMTICCFGNCISVCSFILGKLRGATYLPFDDIEDLPYLWLQHAQELQWMQGLHDNIYLYGARAYRVIEILQPFWDEAGTIIKMDSLDDMMIEAEETTYGFNLEQAFPAVLLALDLN
ncbi:hypothetical protein LX73_1673 [Fodinibius salinus]|uniref:Uncharacterized protein n=1 Tax=Fodinibius salinus TaxID=860790 RepID=A0A5D3YLZ9_9BACT|nr:hypothetical protein [Fodinibius salinus]TYP93956.1 hypothetical protein LX73_1673 [Fodinibius salinus]